jgi:hypothetical protein
VSTPAPEAEVATVVEAYQDQRLLIQLAVTATVIAAWTRIDPARALAQWVAGAGARIFAAVALAQESVAALAPAYIRAALAAQGEPAITATLNPLALAGRTSSGDDLEGVLRLAAVRAEQATVAGLDRRSASQRSAVFLRSVIQTEVPDAARTADQIATVTAEPAAADARWRYGWVRVVNAGACSRCAILAGKFFKWNQGFFRHENCRCFHVPSVEAVANQVSTDPMTYFRSLTPAEKIRLFGKRVSEAIEAGGDIFRVVNAAEGGMRIAGARRVSATGRVRPTPYQLMQDARGDRDEAVRLLRQFGYILR